MTRLLRAVSSAATLAAAAALAATAQAQSGGNANAIANGNYLAGSTWDTGATPAGDQDAQIASSFNVSIGAGDVAQGFRVIVGQSATAGDVGTLTMTGGTLNTDRVLSLGGFENAATLVGKGVFNQSGGDVFVDAITPGAGFAGVSVGDAGASQGEYNLSGGTMNMPGLLQIAVTPTSVGTVNQTGGAINAGNMNVGHNGQGSYTLSSGAATIVDLLGVGSSGSAAGDVDQTGGVINAGQVQVGRDGTGVYDMSGGQLISTGVVRLGNGPNSTGTLTVSGAAVLNAQGGLSVAAETGSGGGTPTGVSGTLNIVGSAATILSGDLNANGGGGPDSTSSSTINWTIDAGGVSTIAVLGAADVDFSTLDLIESVAVSPGQSFDLISTTNGILNAGTVALGSNAAGLYTLSVVSGGGGDVLVATKIPEPATLMLAGLAGLGMMAGVGRRK